MCTILFSWKTTADYKLVLAANRDEFHERGTLAAQWWDDHPDILAGRDLKAGGTWMGINKNGRFAAITNYRKFPLETYETSRGDLVKDYLTSREHPSRFMNFLHEKGQLYDGFNLIFGNVDELFYFSNRGPSMPLEASIYGLSNHLLDTPWPKVSKGKDLFSQKLNGDKFDREDLFSILVNKEVADDQYLPDTGVGIEKERLLSSIFIESPQYGTRLSTFLSIDNNGKVDFHERSYVPKGEHKFEFKV
jgi:uncharacterized protein with NRDE domain